MMKRLGLICLTLLPASFARAEAEPELKLPLSEYQKLRDANETPAVTVVDLMRVTGGFAKGDLALVFSGRSSGRRSTVPVLTVGSGLRLFDCQGDAIVSRNTGTFDLTPLASRYTVRCRLTGAGSDRIEMGTTASVLWLEAAVSDGEPVATDSEDGSRRLVLVRARPASQAEVVKPSVIARYRVTLHPGETRFRYQFDVRNPNRSRARFEVTLRGGEHVQQVDSASPYEVSGSTYQFDLAPGDRSAVMVGTLTGDAFTPPVEASVQYLLVEAHPLLRPMIRGTPKRISPGETGLPADFRGAQAFLLDGTEPLAWDVTRLEAMRTTSFAVPQATHEFFVTREANVLSESVFQLDNQGAADITLPMKAEPTYASLDDNPVLLTRNAAGDLWTPLSQGKQTLLVQSRGELSHRWGFTWGQLWLPQLSAATSYGDIQAVYPEEWQPLFERFQSDARFTDPPISVVLRALIVLLWSWYVARSLGLTMWQSVQVGLAAGAASFCVLWAFWILAGANAVVMALTQRGSNAWSLFVLTGLAVGVAAMMAGTMFFSSNERGRVAYMAKGGLRTFGKEDSSDASSVVRAEQSQAQYEGLPAKITLPSGRHRSHFGVEMLSTDTPRSVTILAIRSRVLDAIASLVAFVSLLVIARRWRALRDGYLALLARKKAVPITEGGAGAVDPA